MRKDTAISLTELSSLNQGLLEEKSVKGEGNDIESLEDEMEVIPFKQAFIDIFNNSAKFIGCRLIYLGGTVASIAILGNEGNNALPASSLINTTQTAVTYTSTAIVYSVGIYAKGAIAEDRNLDVGKVFRQGITMSIVVSIPTAVVTYFLGSILHALGQKSEITDIIDEYNRWYLWSVPANTLFMHNMQLLLATKDFKAIAGQAIIYSAFLIGFSELFLKGHGGFPKMGAGGIGVANIIASWGSVLPTQLYLYCAQQYKPYQLFNFQWHGGEGNYRTFFNLLKKGFPIGVQSGVETIYLTLMAQFLGLISKDALSASSPVWNISSLMTPITFSLAHVAGVLVRNSIGKQRFQDARRYGNASVIVGQMLPWIVFAAFLIVPDLFIAPFIDIHSPSNADIVPIARRLLFVYGAGLIPDAIRNVSAGASRGYNDTAFAMLEGTIDVLLLGTLMSSTMGFESSLGADGVMAGRVISFSLGALVMWSYWKYRGNLIQDQSTLIKEQGKNTWETVSSWMAYILNLVRAPSNSADSKPVQSKAPAASRKRWGCCFFSSNEKAIVESDIAVTDRPYTPS